LAYNFSSIFNTLQILQYLVDINNFLYKIVVCKKGVQVNKKQIDFEIRPIFQPSDEICKMFADIDIACGSSDEPDLRLLCRNLDKEYLKIWNQEKNVFAFAAYKSEEIIGFTTGFLRGKNIFTNALYVIPEYQGYGIGSKLLNTAECASSFVAQNMELFPLGGSFGFYQNRGYKNVLVLGRIKKVKELQKTSGVIPVFQWCPQMQTKLNVKFDTDVLKQKYQPIFVYVNGQQQIDGVAIRMQNGKNKVAVNTGKKTLSEYCKQELVNALSRSL